MMRVFMLVDRAISVGMVMGAGVIVLMVVSGRMLVGLGMCVLRVLSGDRGCVPPRITL